jgi:hypothetical protein
MSVANFPPASLEIQLAELKRERKMRERVYPNWIQNKNLTPAKADYQMNALDGAIATIEAMLKKDIC